MSKSFFLTRQSANLMEDFIRELKADSGLFLIYGDEGVGKTRLLEELTRNRLSDYKIHWMDLKAGESGEAALVDSSELIENTFARAGPGDVIVADHFEMALKKTRHQLFLSWSTDGIDKKLNLIVASNNEFFNELRQLAQQYQVRVQSFQQMPFNADEAAAFLGFYLFPDRPIGELSIPPLLRDQIATAQGNVGRLIEIAERAGDQIGTEPMNDSASIRRDSRMIVGVLVAVALVIGVGWYFLSGHRLQQPEMPVATQESAATLQNTGEMAASTAAGEQAESEVGEPLVEVGEAQAGEGADAVESAASSVLQDGVVALASADEIARDASAPTTATEPEFGGEGEVSDSLAPVDDTAALPGADDESADSSPALVSSPEPETMAQSDEAGDVAAVAAPAAVDTPGAQATTFSQAAMKSARLRSDLQSSLEWINSRDRKNGTLQIMLLSQARFDERVYYEYLERLARQGIDVASVRIFETYTGNREVFSVVYGEYPDRAAAFAARSELAAELRKASPIARSVGGLMEEIRRLRDRN